MRILEETPRTAFAASAFAPAPAESRGVARDRVRLLVARPEGITHARFDDLADQLEPGDLVVVNDSATMAAQIDVVDETGRRSVLHVATPGLPLDDGTVVVEVRTAPDAARAVLDAQAGTRFRAGTHGVTVTLLTPYPHPGSSPTGSGTRLWRASGSGDLDAHLERHGRPISYGYLDHRYPLSAYQTVFSRRPGSAEMPSAARPFTPELVTDLVTRGIAVAPITLHTGVSSQEAGEGPQAERYAVPESTARLVELTRRSGGRVVAVGTTVTRALESAVDGEGPDASVVPRRGWTERVVTPSHPPRVVTGLITGWHDPGASHLLLVEAVAGPALTQAAYDAAVAEGYLWHEFGDSALLLP